MGWSGIELYYTPGSPHCRAVLMCIKALELDVDLSKVDMYQKFEHRKPWFVQMNPQRTVPTLNDNGFVLWESRAILCYLANKYGGNSPNPKHQRLYPKDPELRAHVDRMLFFDSGSLYKNILDYLHPKVVSGEEGDQRKENALKTALDYLDGMMAKQTYAAGDYVTIADLSILSSLVQLEAMDYSVECYRNIHAWMERLKNQLPYYEECNAAGVEMFRNWVKARKSTTA